MLRYGYIQLCGWHCLSGWLPWKYSARILWKKPNEEIYGAQ